MQGDQACLQDVPRVTISPQGIFKYILIEGVVSRGSTTTPVNFIRGDLKQQYHADNLQRFKQSIQAKGFQIKKWNKDKGVFDAIKGDVKVSFKCPGGGRIQHNYNGHQCFIYGYSKSFGRVDHKIAQKMISEALGYPLNKIETSQQGY